MSLLTHNYFKIQMNYLRLLGIWPIYEFPISYVTRCSYAAYSVLMICFYCLYTTLETIEIISLFENLDIFVECFPFWMQHFVGFFKIIVFVSAKKCIQFMQKESEVEPFQRPNQEEFQKEAAAVKDQARRATFTFTGFCIAVIILISAAAVFNGSTDLMDNEGFINGTFDNRPLPLHHWIPSFIDQQISPNYEIIFFLQIFGLCIVASMIVAIDASLWHFLMHVTLHFRCLQKELLNVRQESLDTVMTRRGTIGSHRTTKSYLNEETEREITKEMITRLQVLIRYHQKILDYSANLEDACNLIFFVQMFCTLAGLGSLLYQLSEIEVGSAQWFGMVFCVPVYLIQPLVSCWFGNVLMVESSNVFNAVYECKWEQINYEGGYKDIFPYLSMIMHRSYRPTIVTAGKFTPMTLSLFVSLLKASYTCYTVFETSGE